MNNQPEPLPRTYSILQMDKISMYGLDKAHRKFSNTPENKYWYQQIMIISIREKKSKTNDGLIKNKPQRKVI